jgi:aminoglycoside/choline kinase family phosphotransferase
VEPFLAIAAHLMGCGLSPPAILAADRANGFLLLEDLGDDLFARVAAREPAREAPLYAAAADVLAQMQAAPAPPGLRAYDTPAMVAAAGLAPRWYCLGTTGAAVDAPDLAPALAAALDGLPPVPPVLVHRDYHAENLLWLPARGGVRRVGLLDFQLAEMGHPAYDLVSLIQDARRDVSAETAALTERRFADSTGHDLAAVQRAVAALGAQRALRILGTFARLSLHYGKPGYVRLIPRVWGQLQTNLRHPALGAVARVVAQTLPEPTEARLARIVEQCATHPAP